MGELEAMATFVCVVESGSFSAAARLLGTSQPSVSRRVRALEGSLGASLLTRTTRRLSLTEAGQRYYEAARRALAAIEEARSAATETRTSTRGRLRITAPVSFSTSWLAPRVPRFFEAYPAVELRLHFTEQHVDLVEEGMDLGIRVGGPESAELVGRRVGQVRRHLVASRAWVHDHGRPQRPEDLDDAHGLVFSSSTRWDGWPVTIRGQRLHVAPRRRTFATSGDFLRVLVQRGEGVALLPDWLVHDDLEAGRLERLLPDATTASVGLWLVWPAQRYPSASAEAFVDWFCAEASATWAAPA
ncbi:MAG: LysR family transcriptional regulator [Sandaracinaceae bacterium]